MKDAMLSAGLTLATSTEESGVRASLSSPPPSSTSTVFPDTLEKSADVSEVKITYFDNFSIVNSIEDIIQFIH